MTRYDLTPTCAATGVLVSGTCVAGAVPPAVFAARRDPLHELRTP